MIFEADGDGRVVWKIAHDELPGVSLKLAAGFQRLPNGNTVLANFLGHGELGSAPHLIEAWRQDIFLPYLQQEERAAAALENGRIPRNALTENFATLAYSPGAHAILKLMLGEGQGEVAAMKQMHRRMLLEWLQIDPAARPDAAGRGTNPPEGDDASG